MAKDLYKILGIEQFSPDDKIKRAFRKKAKDCHPDHCGEQGKSDFIELMEAYETLGDCEKKAAYDASLRSPSHRPFGASPIEPLDDEQPYTHKSPPSAEVSLFEELANLFYDGMERDSSVFRSLEQYERETRFIEQIFEQLDQVFEHRTNPSFNNLIDEFITLFDRRFRWM